MEVRIDLPRRRAASPVPGRASTAAPQAEQAVRDDGRWTSGASMFGPGLVLAGCVAYALFDGASNSLIWIPLGAAIAHAVHYARRIRGLEAALAHERLTVLSLELRPHFLLNALNAAAELVHQDADAADRMLTALGQLLGHALRDGRRHEVPLARELDLLQQYVEVERVRFGSRMMIKSAIAREALTVSVPPFLLQPLVENALTHGIAPRAMRGTICIVARRHGDMLRLEVSDDGIGFDTSPTSRPVRDGVGLANVRARLRQLHGTRQSVDITSRAGCGTTVTIHLPWRSAGQA